MKTLVALVVALITVSYVHAQDDTQTWPAKAVKRMVVSTTSITLYFDDESLCEVLKPDMDQFLKALAALAPHPLDNQAIRMTCKPTFAKNHVFKSLEITN